MTRIRSRQRLAEVMRTVNPEVVGQRAAKAFTRAAGVIERGELNNKLLYQMAGYASKHASQHIRELATESNTYMILDGLEA